MLELQLDLHNSEIMTIAGIIIKGNTPDQLESGISAYLNRPNGGSPGFYRHTPQGITGVEGFTRNAAPSEVYIQFFTPGHDQHDTTTVLFLQQEEISTFFRTGILSRELTEHPTYTISFALRSGITVEKKAESRIRLLSYSVKKTKELLLRELSLLAEKALHTITNNGESGISLLPQVEHPAYSPTGVFRHRINQLFSVYKWNIGIIDLPIQQVATGRGPFDVQWLVEAPGNDFKADPFGISLNGSERIFYEYYNAKERKGYLQQIENGNEKEFIRKDYHLSYPFQFSHERDNFILPEAADNNSTILYRLNDGDAEPIGGLLEAFQAVDPTVFFYENRWWLFCTSKKSQGSDLRLFIFYAVDPRGPWIPHRANPVKTDIYTSRPGGTPFFIDDKLIRPAQDSSLGYGSAIYLMEITALSPDTFHERIFRKLKPEDFKGPYKQGIHTISALGNKTLIDGKRKKITLQPFFHLFVK